MLALTCKILSFEHVNRLCFFSVNHSNCSASFLMCFSVLFQSGRPSQQRHQRGTTVSLFIFSALCFRWMGQTGSRKFPRRRIPSVPLVPADLAVIFFSVTGALTLSVLIILPRISGLYSQIIADYPAECEINPLTASHWCSAACWEHYRAPGSNCSAPRSQQRVQ